VFDPDSAKCAAFAEKGAQIAESAAAACEAADYILLAVKPQIIRVVLDGLRAVDFSGKTILSIAAGVSTTLIERILGRELPVVRIMPNTAAAIGLGAIAYSVNARVSDEDAADIAGMLG
jgi:pyrroline-5-carboxylate reductase